MFCLHLQGERVSKQIKKLATSGQQTSRAEQAVLLFYYFLLLLVG
jgi:hypothetical protein